MKIENEPKLDFNNVLIRPKRSVLSSRSQVSLERTFKFPHSTKTWTGVPILAANMDSTGTFQVYDALKDHKMVTCLHKFYSPEKFNGVYSFKQYERDGSSPVNVSFIPKINLDKRYFMISTGIGEADFENLVKVSEDIEFDWICIDVANGYMEKLVSFCKRVRQQFPDKIIVAGNVVSREMVEELILNGKVDVVKVGIGGGSACLTRKKTGVGMPQLSAVIECADAAHGVGGYIISDGGITCPGDMSKAFGGGADFVMVGGQFSGHDENPGDVVEKDGKKYKMFYGMSSEHAMKKHYGKMENYRSSEGRVIQVPYKGSIHDTVQDYLGGLRSTCTYINASCIKHMSKCTTFVLVSQQLNNPFHN